MRIDSYTDRFFKYSLISFVIAFVIVCMASLSETCFGAATCSISAVQNCAFTISDPEVQVPPSSTSIGITCTGGNPNIYIADRDPNAGGCGIAGSGGSYDTPTQHRMYNASKNDYIPYTITYTNPAVFPAKYNSLPTTPFARSVTFNCVINQADYANAYAVTYTDTLTFSVCP